MHEFREKYIYLFKQLDVVYKNSILKSCRKKSCINRTELREITRIENEKENNVRVEYGKH